MEPPHSYYRRLRTAPRLLRVLLGVVLIIGGIFGFLPVLGFWMIPLGLAVIFLDAPLVRRAWSRLRAWWKARTGRNAGTPPRQRPAGAGPGPPESAAPAAADARNAG